MPPVSSTVGVGGGGWVAVGGGGWVGSGWGVAVGGGGWVGSSVGVGAGPLPILHAIPTISIRAATHSTGRNVLDNMTLPPCDEER
ncbi:MAG TPA: hypothetical protein ENJ02_04195 [Chloroflexi bacterium]|nr:hypothetical protein [Chloroflexota bacterium]